MPSTLRAGNELQQFAVATHQKMGGDPQSIDGGVVRVRMGIQAIGEKLDDPLAAKLVWRQADCMDHDQFDIRARRTGVTVG